MSQQACRLVSDENILGALLPASIRKVDASRVIIPLTEELKKIFEHDAEAALDPIENQDELTALGICKTCSLLELADDVSVCVDGEELEKALSGIMGHQLPKVADFAIFETLEDAQIIAHIAEAKLGERRKEKPNFPKCKELQDKFQTLASRLKERFFIGEQFFFIVPMSSYEGQRRRTRHWNEAGSFFPRKLVCLCVRAFLDRFAVSCTEKPICEVPMSSVL